VAPKSELVRVAAVPMVSDATNAGEGRVSAVLDQGSVLPGRGAYLCRMDAAALMPKPQCLSVARRKGGLQRALRRPVELSTELLDAGALESDCEGGAAGHEFGWPHRGCEPKASVFPASAGPSS
jgi:predicted RNA-binding protein YlxR (DUF448 family)